MLIVLLVLTLVFSANAKFSAELDLLEPSLSCRITNVGFIKSIELSADELNQKWRVGFEIKEDLDRVTCDIALWQKKEKQGYDFAFSWKSGHATLQGKLSQSEGKSSWSPKIMTNFNPYIDASLQYEYLTNGGKWQLSWKKRIDKLNLTMIFSHYRNPVLQSSIYYNAGLANLDLSLNINQEGFNKAGVKLGFKQDLYQGSIRIDFDKKGASSVSMQLGVAGLKIDALTKNNNPQLGLATALSINEFSFFPSLTLSRQGLRFGFKLKIA